MCCFVDFWNEIKYEKSLYVGVAYFIFWWAIHGLGDLIERLYCGVGFGDLLTRVRFSWKEFCCYGLLCAAPILVWVQWGLNWHWPASRLICGVNDFCPNLPFVPSRDRVPGIPTPFPTYIIPCYLIVLFSAATGLLTVVRAPRYSVLLFFGVAIPFTWTLEAKLLAELLPTLWELGSWVLVPFFWILEQFRCLLGA